MSALLASLTANPLLLSAGVVLDLAVGDPHYRWHPVRLIGRALTAIEERLRAAGFDGYGGGIALFVLLATLSLAAVALAMFVAGLVSNRLAWVLHAFLLYSLLALGDLLHHVWRIERAVGAGDLPAARAAVSQLVGRDTDRMDAGGCRRAAVESLSENLTDGFVSPVFWYVIGGLPGIVLFKVVSTMDSMVGYKTPRYLRFGWCGARLDDVMNYLPARITAVAVWAVAMVVPGCSYLKAREVSRKQHHLLLGPNAGWSEAAVAGALQRRIVGPIWLHGAMVTDLWIGDRSDPPLETAADVTRAMVLVVTTGLGLAALAILAILWVGSLTLCCPTKERTMHRMMIPGLSVLFVLAPLSPVLAQLIVAKDGPVVYGHHHLNVTNVDAHKKFFVDTLGGTLIKVGTNNAEIVKFPNVFIFFRQQAPTGGTKGTTANHIGFSVPNLRQTVDKVKAAGYRMVTKEEATPDREVKDDIAGPAQPGGASIAFIMGPDDTKVELVEVKTQTIPIALHHVHFFNPKNVEMRDWYVKTFGARAGAPGGSPFVTGTLPGVSLNFSPSPTPVVGTQGRALDHVGFEVKNLEEFCKKLEADGIKIAVPYRKVPALNIAIAFITDPWGTYIELTEGLDKVS